MVHHIQIIPYLGQCPPKLNNTVKFLFHKPTKNKNHGSKVKKLVSQVQM
jgi:hypothetical protein